MAEAERWKPYTQRQGQLLPAFVEDALGATQGVYSGREIARRCRRDLGFRYLVGASAVPDFRTINRFRVRHREDVAWSLRETLRLARAGGAS